MKIIIDAMGGDYAPEVPCRAAAEAVDTISGIEVILVGKSGVIENELKKYNCNRDKISVVNAEEVITNHEEPAKAVRHKKDASVVVAARMLKCGGADAMLSCGNTGALLSAGLLIVGRIKGVIRPALATILPAEKGPVLLLDAGANTNCKPENLVQFAMMGNNYMRDVMAVENPSIGLMSNGAEEGKGDTLTKETYPLLKQQDFNFIGNIEGRDVMEGTADVIVCDGFAGNIILKTVEGMGAVIGRALKGIFTKNIVSKIGALFVMDGVRSIKKQMDYREYGGAPLLGVKAPVIKGHGSSDVKAVISAIKQAKKFVETGFVKTLEEDILKQNSKTEKGSQL